MNSSPPFTHRRQNSLDPITQWRRPRENSWFTKGQRAGARRGTVVPSTGRRSQLNMCTCTDTHTSRVVFLDVA